MLLSAVLFVLFLAGCWLYCLIDAALTPAAEFRGLRKNAWIYTIAATFVVGAFAWLIARRSRRTKSWVTTQARPGAVAGADFSSYASWTAADTALARHPAGRSLPSPDSHGTVPTGPDDDEDFLRQLDHRIRGTSADPGELPRGALRVLARRCRNRGQATASRPLPQASLATAVPGPSDPRGQQCEQSDAASECHARHDCPGDRVEHGEGYETDHAQVFEQAGGDVAERFWARVDAKPGPGLHDMGGERRPATERGRGDRRGRVSVRVLGHDDADRTAHYRPQGGVHDVPHRVQYRDLAHHELAGVQHGRGRQNRRSLQHRRYRGDVPEPAKQAKHEDHGVAVDTASNAAGENQRDWKHSRPPLRCPNCPNLSSSVRGYMPLLGVFSGVMAPEKTPNVQTAGRQPTPA
jgi:hypothetical protein